METGRFKTISLSIKALILGLYVVGGSVLAQTLPLSRNLVAFNSAEGEQLLLESKARKDYWNLSMQFVTQNNQAYCGVASIVMVLNALSIPAPVALEYSPYHVFIQDNFFNNEQTKKVLSPEVVSRQGMTLDQLGQLLGSYPVKVKVYHASESSLEKFRASVVANLKQLDNFVFVNYLRKSMS